MSRDWRQEEHYWLSLSLPPEHLSPKDKQSIKEGGGYRHLRSEEKPSGLESASASVPAVKRTTTPSIPEHFTLHIYLRNRP